ncbi:MAG: asparaginase [Parcubacteria group bacterium]|nr:asparaginase [Parcubacteria group bacterium]
MQKSTSGALDMQNKEEAIDSLLKIEPNIDSIADIDILYIDNIDSTNMNTDHWDQIAQAVDKNYDKYDGFVITHGTNTMAYTASALSYALGDLGKPVVLTGSQIPGDKIETDARRNFVNAIRVATMDLAGVVLVFDEEIIIGSRASKVSESKLDGFETINWDLLGQIRIDIRLHPGRVVKRHSKPLKLQIGFEKNIAVIHLVPGMDTSLLEKILRSNAKGIILRGFGPGDIGYDYLDFIKKAREKDIPVVIDSQCLEGSTMMHINDVGKKALEAGAIQAYDMSIESVTTKLMWALKRAKSIKEIQKVMHTNYTGEINKKGEIY